MNDLREKQKDVKIAVTFEAENVEDLIRKMKKFIGEWKADNTDELEFPEDVMEDYPNYEDNPLSAIIITVLREKHKGEKNSVVSSDLADEMIDRFPRFFKECTVGEVSKSIVLPANFLEKNGLIKIGYDKGDSTRWYWVE